MGGGEMNISYTNTLSTDDYNRLRTAVGWNSIEPSLAQKGLDNSAFLIVASDGDTPVGMARYITDYGYVVYVADVIVAPDYQRNGIGKELMTRIMNSINADILPGQRKFINLMAAKGKENFHKQFGFNERPNDIQGPGMTQIIEK